LNLETELRTDKGGEYIDDGFMKFHKQQGILRQFIVVNTAQYNSVAERMNQTLLERTRVMLRTTRLLSISGQKQSKLPAT